MSNINLQIPLQPIGNFISIIDTTPSLINVSKSITDILSPNYGKACISINNYRIGITTSTLIKKPYNGIMWATKGTVTLTIKATGAIKIDFDRMANQYAKKIVIDNDTNVFNNDFSVIISLPQNITSIHTIQLSNWNREDYNACITYIGEMDRFLKLDKRWIKSIGITKECNPNYDDIFYGSIAQTGYVEINDIKGYIKKDIEMGAFTPNQVKTSTFFNGKLVNSNLIINGQYDVYNKKLSLSLQDFIYNMSTNKISKVNYKNQSTNLYLVLMDNFSNYSIDTSKIIKIFDNTEITIKEYMQKIIIPYYYLNDTNEKNLLDSICNIAQLQAVCSGDNSIQLFSARPKALDNELNKYIIIKKNNTYATPEQNMLLINNYDSIIFDENVITHKNSSILFDININLGSRNIIELNNRNQNAIFEEVYYKYIFRGRGKILINHNKSYIVPNKELNVSNLKINVITNKGDSSISKEETDYNLIYQYNANTLSYSDFIKDVDNRIENIDTPVKDLYYEIISVDDEHSYVYFDVALGDFVLGESVNYESLSLSIINEYIIHESKNIKLNSTGKNSYTLTTNELMNDLVYYDNLSKVKMKNIIYQNITNDYAGGIPSIKTKISASNYYYNDNTIAKNFENGDIIEIGDIIKFEFDNINLWKVISSKLIYENSPMVELVAIQIKQ